MEHAYASFAESSGELRIWVVFAELAGEHSAIANFPHILENCLRELEPKAQHRGVATIVMKHDA